VDQDVFTPYKRDHRYGLGMSESIGYRPWLDTEWWVRGSLTTNEDFNPVDPDHVTGRIGWDQFLDGWVLGLDYRASRFFADDDRDEARTRQAVTFRALRDLWATPTSRIEAGLEIEYDFPEGEVGGVIFIAWHWSRGRVFRDFRPGEVDFSTLRAAGVPFAHCGRIAEATDE
jgi:hypothetical protein